MNAVILYNYVHEMINGEGFDELFNSDKNNRDKDSVEDAEEDYDAQSFDVKSVLKNKLEEIKKYYRKYCGEKCIKRLVKAVEHIQKYVETLPLNEYLYKFRANKQEYDEIEQKPSNLAPDLHSEFKENGGILSSPFYHADKGDYSIKVLEYPSIECINGELYILGLGIKKTKLEINTGYVGGSIFGGIIRFFTKDNSFDFGRYYQEWIDCNNIYELKKQDTWIAERLEGLAQIPTKEFLDEWVPLTDNGEENEQNN